MCVVSCEWVLLRAGCEWYRLGKTKVFLKQHHTYLLRQEMERVHRAATILQKCTCVHCVYRCINDSFVIVIVIKPYQVNAVLRNSCHCNLLLFQALKSFNRA